MKRATSLLFSFGEPSTATGATISASVAFTGTTTGGAPAPASTGSTTTGANGAQPLSAQVELGRCGLRFLAFAPHPRAPRSEDAGLFFCFNGTCQQFRGGRRF